MSYSYFADNVSYEEDVYKKISVSFLLFNDNARFIYSQ
jgi:hypothetical protein